MAIAGTIELLIPVPVLEELQRVLAEKFRFSPERLAGAMEFLREVASEFPAAPAHAAIEQLCGDPADDLIIAAATGAQADTLVTGDLRHMLPLETVRGMRIMTPQALLFEQART